MRDIIIFLLAYLLGNLMTGQVIAICFYKKDLHKVGSGNIGARNAGRVFGKAAFVLTFLGDAGKGAVIILVARYLEFSFSLQLVALFFVVLGHILPIAFQFKGGKGMATFIGGMLSINPFLFIFFILVFLCFYLWLRNLTMAGMAAVGSYPILMMFLAGTPLQSALCACLSALVVFAHRQNITAYVQQGKH